MQSGQTKHKRSSSGMHQITPGEWQTLYIFTQYQTAYKSYKANKKVNGVPLEMEIDTVAAVSIVGKVTWVEKLNKPTLKPCPLLLKGYPDNELHIMGYCDVQVQAGEIIKQLELIVCKGNGLSLLGRNWLEEIKLNWSQIAHANSVTKDNQPKLERILDKINTEMSLYSRIRTL